MTSAGGPGRVAPLDLDEVRDRLAAAPDAGRLQPIGLSTVIEGDGALDQLTGAVAATIGTAPTGRTSPGRRISRRIDAKSSYGSGARAGDAESARHSGAGGEVVVLAADTPMLAAGGRDLRSAAEAALGARHQVRWVSLGAEVHADAATVAAASAAAAGAGCVVTVGSGTITDIGKAAVPAGTPLVAVQTATSVNGYADPLSVLLRDGVKRTTPTRWPDVLLIDPAVLAAAPPALNRAGAGDMMGMFTAAADWYLASVLHTGPRCAARRGPALPPRRHGAHPPARHPAAGAGGGPGPARASRRGAGAVWTDEPARREDGASGAPRRLAGQQSAGRAGSHPDLVGPGHGRGRNHRAGIRHGARHQPPAGDGR